MNDAPILVVDDDPAILETVSEILEFEGHTVLRAASSAEGLHYAERFNVALILLDMRMPDLDGWGFASTLKARGIALPIVVMTAAQDARRWAQEIGAAAYLAKPFELLELLETVERVGGAAR